MLANIYSSQNKNYKRWMSLHNSQGVKRHAQCLVSGSKIVNEIMVQFPHLCLEWITSEFMPPLVDLPITFSNPPAQDASSHLSAQFLGYRLPDSLFKKLDLSGTHSPLLTVKTPPLRTFSQLNPTQGLEVLCGLGDPHNVGALARCCEAFKVRRLILLKSSVHPFHPKVIRSSSGSVFRLCMEEGFTMGDMDFEVVALDPLGSEKIENFHWPQNTRLLIGEEGQGLPKNLTATRLRLPMAPSMDSLNAVAALSIALYSYHSYHHTRNIS